MIYNKFKDLSLSALGFGTMRFPTLEGNDAHIDIEKTRQLLDYALKMGINYFDTAWGYHGGNSERVVGEILSAYPRESFYLASKFPGYDLNNMGKVESIFEEQLKKCRTQYFDFYLIHNVCESNINAYLDESYGTLEYLLKQKQNGRIRHLGFSVHGNIDTMNRFLEVYGDYMEFCQVQLNYIDYHFQNAKAKLEVLKKRGIDVWVMEPLRGGKLANLPEDAKRAVESIREKENAVSMAFRYLQSFPQVKVVLSGMSNLEQLSDNIRIFSEKKPVTEEECARLYGVASKLVGTSVPCTSCKYCVSHCPKEIDIPRMIELYNEHVFTGGGFLAPMGLQAIAKERHPDACIGCRSCEAVCPQEIKISEILYDFAQKLN